MVPTGEFGEGLTLPQLKQLLFDKETSYTDRHPDVIRLKSKIAEMEAKIKSGEYESEPSNLGHQQGASRKFPKCEDGRN